VFLTTPHAKARLVPALAPGNVQKTQAAPVNVIVAWDTEFYDLLPRLFPHHDMRPLFVGKPAAIEEAGLRKGSLQGRIFHSCGAIVGPGLWSYVWV
jgi:3-hydroxypropanoate dehydrogenase